MYGKFLIFFSELIEGKGLKLNKMNFLNKLCFEVLGPKVPQNEVFDVFDFFLYEVAAA